MRVDQVPQDDSILEGHRRACYARDEAGRYVIAESRGWEVERIANQQAVAEIEARVREVLQDARAGKASALAYHMTRFHMEPSVLAAHAGFWTWRVKRHLRPEVFRALPEPILRRYARVFNIDVAALCRVPE
jgi:hypothetical protein